MISASFIYRHRTRCRRHKCSHDGNPQLMASLHAGHSPIALTHPLWILPHRASALPRYSEEDCHLKPRTSVTSSTRPDATVHLQKRVRSCHHQKSRQTGIQSLLFLKLVEKARFRSVISPGIRLQMKLTRTSRLSKQVYGRRTKSE